MAGGESAERHDAHQAPRRASALLNYFIRPQQQRLRDREPEGLGRLEVITSSNLVGCSIARSPGLAPLECHGPRVFVQAMAGFSWSWITWPVPSLRAMIAVPAVASTTTDP
jgi:hypothetical protein